MATADWNPLGDFYYKKSELYTMEWFPMVNLDDYIVAAAPYGGPIALYKDESKSARVQVSLKPVITVYTSAGTPISQLRWNSGQMIKMAWSNMEDLVCVQDDGVVLLYDLFLTFKKTFSMGQEAKDMKVVDCQIFNSFQGTGIAIMTSTYNIFIVNNIEDVRLRKLAEIPGANPKPSSWTIINFDRQSRALVTKGSELFLLDHGGQYQSHTLLTENPISEVTAISVSHNNKLLALFSDSGFIIICSADLQKVHCEFNTKTLEDPQQIVWCGSGAVATLWGTLMLVIGPDKDWIKLTFDTTVHLVQEFDGIRIIGNELHEFLHQISSVTENIFKIGSMAPGAMLYEASREFSRQCQKADEYVRMIKDSLDVAVEQCIQAAGQEWDVDKQKALLRAATFGKCFITDFNPEQFVNMCQMLRVLNQVRNHKIGIPITYDQLKQLTMPVLIDKLVLRKQFHLAIKICHYLKIPDEEGASRILAHWACYKVQQKSIDDDTIARAISQKLGDSPGVSYCDIASQALECGRTELAIKLLEFEPKAAQQVPLLMKMNKDQMALSKAIESGDSDLVYTVLLRIKEVSAPGDFFMNIRNMPIAYSLFIQYCRQQNRDLMEDLFYQEDNCQEEANCKVERSFSQERLDDRWKLLQEALNCYTRAKNEFAVKQTEEQMKLLKYQRKLEEEFNRPYVDLSLHKTIYKLITENVQKTAEQLRKEFKVPERRYWWLRINALAEAGDWIELDKFSKTKKAPIGMEAFVEVCVKHQNVSEALKYVGRVPPEVKVKCLLKVGQKKQAAELALENRNEEEISLVISRCGAGDKQLLENLRAMKMQLTSRK